MDLLGKTVGRFALTKVIGSGGMGVVYEGTDQILHRSVAIKVISQGTGQSQESIERFFREARAVARLEHPNIVRIYEAGQTDLCPFIAMELVRGKDLRAVFADKPPLGEKLGIMSQVFEGLGHAHSLGVIHRDVKPANVLVDVTGVVKIIDFGLARLAGEDRDLTRGQVFGSVCYMSPEQILDPRSVDWRADIYAAGVILFQFLADRVPFLGKSLPETLSRIVQEPLVFPDHSELDVPDPVLDLVKRCLEKDRNLRPQSASEVAQELRILRDVYGEVGTVVQTGPAQLSRSPSGASGSITVISGPITRPPAVPPPAPVGLIDRSVPPAETERSGPLSPDPPPEAVTDLYEYELTKDISRNSAPPSQPIRRNRAFRHPYLTGALAGLLLLAIALPLAWVLTRGNRVRSLDPPPESPTPAPIATPIPTPLPARLPAPERLTSVTPQPGVLLVKVRSGQEFLFQMSLPETAKGGDLSWRVNDEPVGTGGEFRYRAGKPGFKDLVTATLDAPAGQEAQTLIWYVEIY